MSSQKLHNKASKDDATDGAESVLPDTDILFPPYSSFVRELLNNSVQLRHLMKPRYETTAEPVNVKKKRATLAKKKPATLVKKKPAMLAQKKPATLVRKKPATLVKKR